jgi:putative endonuclease
MQSPFARCPDSRPDEVGRAGESRAVGYLRREKRYSIVARNWRNPRDRRYEIDLVCRDREVLVFVEVKTRSRWAMVPGYYMVDDRKRRALRKVIHAYLSMLRDKPRTFRFDIVEVETDGPVRHYENVDLFSKYYRP